MRKLLNKVVAGVVVGASLVVGQVALADNTAAIKTAMEAIQTEASANTGVMVPIALGTMGVIIGALLVLALMGKIGGKVAR